MRALTETEMAGVAGGFPEGIVMVSMPLPTPAFVPGPPPLSPMPGPNAAPSPYAPYQGGGLL